MGGLSNYFGETLGFPGSGPLPTFWPFPVNLGTVMAPVGVLFSICYCITMSV